MPFIWNGIDFKLRRLELSFHATLEGAANYLPNIEQLTLNNIFDDDQFFHLKRFANLSELGLIGINMKQFHKLNDLLSGINNLKKLEILVITHRIQPKKCQQTIVSLAKTHRNLEQFELCMNRIELNEAIIVDFVRFAPKLKSIHLHDCGIYATASLITKLVNVRKCNQENPNKLALFIDKNRMRNDIDAIKESEAQQHLLVAWNCEHPYY